MRRHPDFGGDIRRWDTALPKAADIGEVLQWLLLATGDIFDAIARRAGSSVAALSTGLDAFEAGGDVRPFVMAEIAAGRSRRDDQPVILQRLARGQGHVPGVGESFNVFGASFFTLTGFHGVHVSIGIIMLMALVGIIHRGRIPGDKAEVVELVGLYWHFVDVVWVVIFTLVYLIPA